MIEVSSSDIQNGLKDLGLKTGMMLEVHCSLSAFGHVLGGAETVIEALMQSVGEEGAIVMPAFRLSQDMILTVQDKAMGIVKKIRILSPDDKRTAMGLVADTFRQRPDVVTGDGIFRACAWGKDAAIHAAKGFGHLIDHGGYALLMGVDIYRLSAMHYVEEALPQAIRDRFQPSQTANEVYPQSEWLIESWELAVKPWYTIQDMAYTKGLIADITIGHAKCMLMEVKPVISLYRQALETDPMGLYGLK